MDVLLLGASGRIGHRIANELLDRGHAVTGVSRSGESGGVDDPDEVAELAARHGAVSGAFLSARS